MDPRVRHRAAHGHRLDIVELDQTGERLASHLDQQPALAADTAGHPSLRHEGQAAKHLLLGFDPAAEKGTYPLSQVLVEGHTKILPAAAAHNVAMTTYSGTDEFEGATFIRASFKNATIRFSDVSGVRMRSVDVDGLDIDSHDLFFGSLVVNGVDVVPLVDAELNRQFPGRELQKAQTPEGLREGWDAVQDAWATTVADTPPELVDAHVEDEWSLAQTLRHLILATDAWLRGGILRLEQPFHEIGQIFSSAGQMGFDMSIFRTDAPSYAEILEVRAERQQLVTDFLATATPELLAEERDNPWGAGDDWHPSVGDCIRVILEEEWAHLRYIQRDLALLR